MVTAGDTNVLLVLTEQGSGTHSLLLSSLSQLWAPVPSLGGSWPES